MSEVQKSMGSPLVIGVTGHRDIDPGCTERVRAEVGALLDRVTALVPATEVRIMVGMAQGADLLVAEVALARQLPVDAVLPMPLHWYEEDFDPASLEQLRHVLRQPQTRCTVLPEIGGASRDQKYVQLTEALIRKSNLLIALWDGEYSPLPGGTADTVLSYLSARPEPGQAGDITFADDHVADSWGHQFVYWVSAARAGRPQQSEAPPPSYLSGVGETLLRRHTSMPSDLTHQLIELDAYNSEFGRLNAKGSFPSFDTLMDELPQDAAAEYRSQLQQIDQEYGKADALAVFYQKHSNRLFAWFSYTASVTGLLFLIYSELVDSYIVLFLYLSLLIVGLIAFQMLKGRQWFAKHLVYRVLAETMRAKFFLRSAAADRKVNARALIQLTGIDQFTGFSWITAVLKNVEPFAEAQLPSDMKAGSRLRAIHKAWVDGQIKYFRFKVGQLERNHQRLTHLKTVLFCVLAVIALALVIFGTQLAQTPLPGGVSVKDVMMFFMGLLPVWLGIWELYQYKMATRELLWQYRNQLSHFERAQLQLTKATTRDQCARILAELGENSLMESFMWTLHRYHREHESPGAA